MGFESLAIFQNPRCVQLRLKMQSNPPAGFNGFHALTANFTQVPNEIWDMKVPGLTYDLRWTLATLARVTIGEAYRRGGSPYDFFSIPWSQWMEMLDLKTVNAVKNRLARMEAMGIIEIQQGTRGSWGTTPNRYRLRWDNDGQAASRAFHQVVRTRGREITRKVQFRASTEGGYSAANTPQPPGGSAPNTPPPNTPRLFGQPNTPSFKQTEYENTPNNHPSVSPSVQETDGRTDLERNSDKRWASWLKPADPEPWPDALFKGLGEILDPPQIEAVEARSAWGEEGAWAILQAISARGRNLRNRPGTLWNALVQPDKGASWLMKAAPLLRMAGWKMEPEDQTDRESLIRARGQSLLTKAGYSRLPLPAEMLERQAKAKAAEARREPDLDLALSDDDDEDDGPADDPGETEMVPATAQPTKDLVKVEDLNPALKAELRSLIEDFREASLAARHSNALSRPGFFASCSRCWEGIGTVLEPVLPLQVTLPDEYRPMALRTRAQIKMNVVNALYKAIS